MTAGRLRERLTFQRRAPIDDGYGNPVTGDWEDRFTVAARVKPSKGGETVLARRLQGVQPVVITVRSSTETRSVTPDWRAVDARTGTVYALRSAADMVEKNAYIEMLAESGVAS
ncbi:phage head closure protein [Kaustia mangrovi]|uniref:Phage head closure protein n=1 Tax=Kaustia mangrovi TaxID=2593653 RepID=A0A7S8C548_9HYPH|nr:phage head closure protein [Kaustia mangrovi]QPC43492.1 phage head closure protein [Kaustia mangrovi]